MIVNLTFRLKKGTDISKQFAKYDNELSKWIRQYEVSMPSQRDHSTLMSVTIDF